MRFLQYCFLFFFLLACSGDAKNETKQANGTIDKAEKTLNSNGYRIIKQEKQIKDDSSPLGYWEYSLSYPEITGSVSGRAKANINQAIVAVVDKYRCGKFGDYTFSSEVKYFDGQLLSLVYDAMWLCKNMPSPDSTSGSLTFRLDTGAILTLKSEFVDAEARRHFYSVISAEIRKKIAVIEAESRMQCPVIERFRYFYKTKQSLALVAAADLHRDSGCTATIELSRNKLRKYLKPNSLLLK